MQRSHAIIGLTAASLLLTGCSLIPGSGDAVPGAGELESPLQKYMAALWDASQYNQEFFDNQQREIEQLIAECMSEQGFEYIPNTQNGSVMFSTDDVDFDGPQWGTLEFAEKYGYGIVDDPYRHFMPSPDPEDEQYVDPNAEYIESLSESEQTAFYGALYGAAPTEEESKMIEEDPDYVWEPTDSGCYGKAEEQVRGQAMEFWDDPEFADIRESIETLYEDVENSPEVRDLDLKWSACMAENGFSGHQSKYSIMDPLYEEWNSMQSGLNGEYREPSEAEKNEFQQREIELAVQDFKCSEKLDYEKRRAEIMIKIEQEFIDQNKDRLDAMLAKHAGNK